MSVDVAVDEVISGDALADPIAQGDWDLFLEDLAELAPDVAALYAGSQLVGSDGWHLVVCLDSANPYMLERVDRPRARQVLQARLVATGIRRLDVTVRGSKKVKELVRA